LPHDHLFRGQDQITLLDTAVAAQDGDLDAVGSAPLVSHVRGHSQWSVIAGVVGLFFGVQRLLWAQHEDAQSEYR